MEQVNQINRVEADTIDFAVLFLQMCVSAALPRRLDTFPLLPFLISKPYSHGTQIIRGACRVTLMTLRQSADTAFSVVQGKNKMVFLLWKAGCSWEKKRGTNLHRPRNAVKSNRGGQMQETVVWGVHESWKVQPLKLDLKFPHMS